MAIDEQQRDMTVGDKTLQEWAIKLSKDLHPEPRLILSYEVLVQMVEAAKADARKEGA